MIDSDEFYSEYFGHKVEHLEVLLPLLRSSSDALIWLAGDSSLDNKYWFQFTQPAVGVYKDVLTPPRSKTDVTYWLNYLTQYSYDGRLSRIPTINTAVEETTLNERTFRLFSQDKLIQDHIGPEDILIVSVGGNDVAWSPCPCTIFSILCLVYLPDFCVDNGFSYGIIPVDDYCCGCCTSLASCACTCPPCLGYFQHLFGIRVEKYIRTLVEKTKPKMILVCMIYYPDLNPNTMSWADLPLSFLRYQQKPSKLQGLISKAFEHATSAIQVPGTQVIPVPLFTVLDGKHSEEYCERVEPSPSGGKLMARMFLEIIDHRLAAEGGAGYSNNNTPEGKMNAPSSETMTGRG